MRCVAEYNQDHANRIPDRTIASSRGSSAEQTTSPIKCSVNHLARMVVQDPYFTWDLSAAHGLSALDSAGTLMFTAPVLKIYQSIHSAAFQLYTNCVVCLVYTL